MKSVRLRNTMLTPYYVGFAAYLLVIWFGEFRWVSLACQARAADHECKISAACQDAHNYCMSLLCDLYMPSLLQPRSKASSSSTP